MIHMFFFFVRTELFLFFLFLFFPLKKVFRWHLIFVKLKQHEIYEICAVREAPGTSGDKIKC